MDLAYLGERTTPSQCGRMDQCCAYSVPVAMEFDGDYVRCKELTVGAPLYLVIVDLCASKNTHVILSDLAVLFFKYAKTHLRKVERKMK